MNTNTSSIDRGGYVKQLGKTLGSICDIRIRSTKLQIAIHIGNLAKTPPEALLSWREVSVSINDKTIAEYNEIIKQAKKRKY